MGEKGIIETVHFLRVYKTHKKGNISRTGIEPVTWGDLKIAIDYNPPLYQLSYLETTLIPKLVFKWFCQGNKADLYSSINLRCSSVFCHVVI